MALNVALQQLGVAWIRSTFPSKQQSVRVHLTTLQLITTTRGEVSRKFRTAGHWRQKLRFMNLISYLAEYKRTIFSREILKRVVSPFFQAFGLLALFLDVFSIFFPDTFNLGYQGIVLFASLSVFYALFTVRPRQEISRRFSLPDIKVSIKVGDLFQEDAHLVIGMNDVFDTEIGDIIKANSIQGQFLKRIYNNERSLLDQDIENALQNLSKELHKRKTIDKQKTRGKNIRYPIGTAITLIGKTRKCFCSAYSRMGSDLKAQSSIQYLSLSLEMLWQEIGAKGENKRVAMAVLGSDLARLDNTASHSDLIKFIVSSFIYASRLQSVTKELTIIVHQRNLEKIHMPALNDFLQNF